MVHTRIVHVRKLHTPVAWAVGSVAIALVATLALAFLVSFWAREALRAQATRALRAEVALAARDLAGRLDARLEDMTQAAEMIPLLGLDRDPPLMQRWLAARMRQMPGAVWMGYTDADGRIRASATGLLLGESAAARDWFVAAQSGPALIDRHEALMLAPYIPALPGEPLRLVDIAAPVRDATGRIIGVTAVHIRWEQVRADLDMLARAVKDLEGAEIILRSADGSTAIGPGGPARTERMVEVETKVVGPGPIGALGWRLAARLPAATLNQAADDLAGRVFWLAGVAAFAALLAAWAALRGTTRSLADARAAFAAVGHLVPGIVFGAIREGGRLRMTHFTSPTGRRIEEGGGAEGFLAQLHPEDRPALLAAYDRAEADPDARPVEIEFRARLPDNASDWRRYEEDPADPERWLRAVLRARMLPSGQTTVEGVALEVTDIKRAAALEAENRHLAELRARDADRMAQNRAEVLAVMAHEVRTPLTGVLGFSELLVAADLPAEAHGHAAIVHETGSMLLAVLNDILDLAKIEAGKVSIERVPFHPRALAEQAIALAGAGAARKGLALRLTVEDTVPDRLLGDPLRIRQVLGNLLGNAVKFTERGGIDVRVLYRDGMLEVSVADTGIGIPKAAMATIFTMFGQAESDTARRFGGTGLGLALCRRLVEAMEGEITVDSAEGRGSVFRFTARLLPAPAEDAPAAAEAPARGALHLLVVDDVGTNRQLLRIMLTGMGHSVTLAESGVEALDALNRERFDAVLMDVNMPEMDGLEATRRIRALPDDRARLPVLALTAGASRADAEQARAAGMTAHVPKPVSRTNLRAALEQCAPVVA